MLNFSKDNLIEVDKSTVASHSLAIKVNDMVLLCGSGNGSDSPGGGTTVGGTFDLAKVTEYSPAVEEFTAPASITIEGIGSFGDPEYPEDSIDYSDANGTYYPTAKTADKTGYARKYKHETNNYWIIGYLDVEGWYDGDIWFIAEDEDAESPWDGFLFCSDEPDLTTGTAYWHNEEWGEGFDLTTTVNIVTTPAAPMVLKGVLVTGYVDSVWAFDENEITFTGFEKTPKKEYIYTANGVRLIGNAVGFAGSIPEEGLIFYDPIDGNNPNVPVVGGKYTEIRVPTENYTTLEGVPCALFNSGNQLKSTNCVSFPANNFTLSIWVHTNDTKAPGNFFGYGRDGYLEACMLRSDASSTGRLGVERGSGQIYSNATIMDNRWHHCACTIGANGENTIWMDGVAVLNFTLQYNVKAEKLAIGTWLNSDNGASAYYAAARIYNRVLSNTEINALAAEFAV